MISLIYIVRHLHSLFNDELFILLLLLLLLLLFLSVQYINLFDDEQLQLIQLSSRMIDNDI